MRQNQLYNIVGIILATIFVSALVSGCGQNHSNLSSSTSEEIPGKDSTTIVTCSDSVKIVMTIREPDSSIDLPKSDSLDEINWSPIEEELGKPDSSAEGWMIYEFEVEPDQESFVSRRIHWLQ